MHIYYLYRFYKYECLNQIFCCKKYFKNRYLNGKIYKQLLHFTLFVYLNKDS